MRDSLTWFNNYAASAPSWGRKAFVVLLGIAVTVHAWDRRGAAWGLAAFAIHGVVFAVAAFKHRETLAWSRQHPKLDSLLLVPLVSLALASFSDLGSAVCVAIGVSAWALLLPLVLSRRKRAVVSGKEVPSP